MRTRSNGTNQILTQAGLSRRSFLAAGTAALATLGAPRRLRAQERRSPVLFTNVRIFNGMSDSLSGPMNVLVSGNKIAAISSTAITPDGVEPTAIDGNGRTLMPGLIDAHWHVFMAAISVPVLMTSETGYLNLLAARQAEATLMRGFTTVRDLGGPVFGIKRAIDEGATLGPRIYASGAFISQTSGHGDFRFDFEIPRQSGGPLSRSEVEGISAIADSPDEVRLRAREQLRRGASQIKVMASGGVSSQFSQIEANEFTEAELRASVEAAEDWGTYVTAHAYTPSAVQRAIRAGVKVIDHGQLADEETVRLMAERDVWWSLQPLTYDADVFARMTPVSQKKALQVFAGTENAYRLAKQYNIKTAWGSDILFDATAAARQNSYLAMMDRWYTPAEALRMATGNNGGLLALSGFINPYPGKLGIVEEGALADLIMVDGDPLADIKLIDDPAKNFVVIMKDGEMFKNTLSPNAELARR
jgi:imidazolonepropionase-like amidohydrolase